MSVNTSAPLSSTSQRHRRKANLLPIISPQETHEFRITMRGKKVLQSVQKTLASRHIPTASPPTILLEKRTTLSLSLQPVSISLRIEKRSTPSILQTTDVWMPKRPTSLLTLTVQRRRQATATTTLPQIHHILHHSRMMMIQMYLE